MAPRPVEEKDRRASRSVTLPVRVWEMLSSGGKVASREIEKAVMEKYEKTN